MSGDAPRPIDFWRFRRNTEDGDVGRSLRLFTTLPLKEIAGLERLDGLPVTNEAATLTAPAVLSAGRKRHIRLIVTA